MSDRRRGCCHAVDWDAMVRRWGLGGVYATGSVLSPTTRGAEVVQVSCGSKNRGIVLDTVAMMSCRLPEIWFRRWG